MTDDTSRKGFRMPLNDDIRKTLTDPTPLYFAAGVLDKIREETPVAIAAVRSADPKEVQAKVTDRAKETQVRMNRTLGGIDTDIKKMREQAQSLAMQGLGYAAEYAVKARETYGELAERGRGAVQTWRGDDDRPEITVEREPVRVAQPPKQPRNGSPSAKGGAASSTRSGGGTGNTGTAKGTTARSTSAKAAAPKGSTAPKSTASQGGAASRSTPSGTSSNGTPSKSTSSNGTSSNSTASRSTASKSTAPKGKGSGSAGGTTGKSGS
ncbi:hypothetical protein N566_27190 [Streptomycetaceae bacterium MP113-05]|nr:hypothetical protein N566_27190 [Streptomycetaceae bacterium MP113-05]